MPTAGFSIFGQQDPITIQEFNYCFALLAILVSNQYWLHQHCQQSWNAFLIKNSENQSLVPRSPDGAVTFGDKSQRLIKRMSEDALKVIETSQRDLARMMRRLGDYELHEEDYQQLNIWARDFTEDGYPITALELADRLSACARSYDLSWIILGRVKEVTFDTFSSDLKIKRLDLTSVPALTELRCYKNQLTKLDMTSVPALTELRCNENQLTKLDMTSVPALTELRCSENKLTELDIRNCKALEKLYCDPAVTITKNPVQAPRSAKHHLRSVKQILTNRIKHPRSRHGPLRFLLLTGVRNVTSGAQSGKSTYQLLSSTLLLITGKAV